MREHKLEIINDAIARCGGNCSAAARGLGISKNSMYRWGVSKPGIAYPNTLVNRDKFEALMRAVESADEYLNACTGPTAAALREHLRDAVKGIR